MGTRRELLEALQQGHAAAVDGQPVSSCPYKVGDVRQVAWVRGYVCAASRPGREKGGGSGG